LILIHGLSVFDSLLSSLKSALEPEYTIESIVYTRFTRSTQLAHGLTLAYVKARLHSVKSIDLIAQQFGVQLLARALQQHPLFGVLRIDRLVLVDPVVSYRDLRFLESVVDSVQIIGHRLRPLETTVAALVQGAASVFAIMPPTSKRRLHPIRRREQVLLTMTRDWTRLGSDLEHIVAQSTVHPTPRLPYIQQEIAKIRAQSERSGTGRVAGPLLDAVESIFEPAISSWPITKELAE
jgi:hypothetical protein